MELMEIGKDCQRDEVRAGKALHGEKNQGILAAAEDWSVTRTGFSRPMP